MKKLSLLILIVLSSIMVRAQNVPDLIRTTPAPATGANKNNRATVDANIKAGLSLLPPTGDNYSLNGAKDSVGYLFYNKVLKRLGAYRGSGIWDNPLNVVTTSYQNLNINDRVQVITDATANFGKSLYLPQGSIDPGVRPIYGPYLGLENGEYTYKFYLKINTNLTDTARFLHVDIAENGNSIMSTYIRYSDFIGANVWTPFRIVFNGVKGRNYECRIDVVHGGDPYPAQYPTKTNLWYDYGQIIGIREFVPTDLSVYATQTDLANGLNSLTSTNGLTKTGGNTQLGGDLINDTYVQVFDKNFSFNADPNGSNFKSGFGITNTGVTINSVFKPTNRVYTVASNVGSAYLSYYLGNGDNSKTIGIQNGLMFISDYQNKGIVYSQDYSSLGKLDDRWIPDWGAVKSIIPAGGIADDALVLHKSDSTRFIYTAGTGLTLATKQFSFNTTFGDARYFTQAGTIPWNKLSGTAPPVSTFINDAGYLTNTTGDARYALITRNIIAGYGNLGGGSFATDRTISTDTTKILTIANYFPKGDTRYVQSANVYNNVDYTLPGKVLDARQGKVLDDRITALATNNAGYIYTKTTYGAKGDAKIASDAVVTAGSTTLTCASCSFTPTDVGKVLAVPYAGTDNGVAVIGRTHMTTIASYTNATTVVLTDAPTKSIVATRTITGVAMTQGSQVLTSAGGNFTNTDIGKIITIPGAGLKTDHSGSGVKNDQTCWIVGVTNSTTITVSRMALANITAQSVVIPGAYIEWGSDDTVPLQNAINAAASQKRELIIEIGRYLTTAGLTVTNNLSIRGFGQGKSIIAPAGFSFSALQSAIRGSILANTVSNMIFQDFEIDCAAVRNSTYSTASKGFFMSPVENTKYINLYIHNSSGTGLGSDYLNNYTIVNNLIEHCGAQVQEFGGGGGGSGIGIGTSVKTESAGIVSGNVIRDCGKYAIFFENQGRTALSRGINIANNYCEWNAYGIGDNGNTNVSIRGNQLYNNSVAGIASLIGLNDLYYSQEGIYENNTIVDNGAGILISQNFSNYTIRNNTIINTLQTGTNAAIKNTAVTAGVYTYLLVENNIIRGLFPSALSIGTPNSGDMTIQNNTIQNIGTSTTTLVPGINLASTSSKVVVKNNQVHDSRAPGSKFTSYGFVFSGSAGSFEYGGNDFSDNATGDDNITATITSQFSLKGPILTNVRPASTFQTPTGTAGTDSLAVKISATGKLGAIAGNFFASSSDLNTEIISQTSGSGTIASANITTLWVANTTTPFTLTLPTAASMYNGTTFKGRKLTFKNIGANNLTIQANGAELIDAANTLVVLPNQSVVIVSDGTKWRIINAPVVDPVDNVLSKTASYTIVAGDFAAGKKTTLDLYVDATAGAVTITLPSASTFAGYTIYITKTDATANAITVSTVTGANTLTGQDQSRQFNSNATVWRNH